LKASSRALAFRARVAMARTFPLDQAHTSSMGLSSGESGGRYSGDAPTYARASAPLGERFSSSRSLTTWPPDAMRRKLAQQPSLEQVDVGANRVGEPIQRVTSARRRSRVAHGAALG
jgi:hypothetical protein